MTKFIRYIFLFLLSVVLAFVAIVLSIPSIERFLHSTDTLYVWGDSQMYQGLNLDILEQQTNHKVLSAAAHGCGVYDFWVSTQRVPDGSTVIVAFPECALFRRPNIDYNQSGLDLRSLCSLYTEGFTLSYCADILYKNRRKILKPVFRHSFDTYDYADTIVQVEPLSGFCDMFATPTDYSHRKCKFYQKGIQQLIDKNCRLIIVQFPFDEQVEACAQNSCNRHLSDSLKSEFMEQYAFTSDSIYLHSDSLLMHDHSHLNVLGSTLATDFITHSLTSSPQNCFLRVFLSTDEQP